MGFFGPKLADSDLVLCLRQERPFSLPWFFGLLNWGYSLQHTGPSDCAGKDLGTR